MEKFGESKVEDKTKHSSKDYYLRGRLLNLLIKQIQYFLEALNVFL